MEFGILGHVEARRDGRDVPIGGTKVRALLAILLLRANEVVSRDRLIEGLWGESPPPSAQHTLDDNVSRLRRALGEGRIERRAPGYRILVEPGELDLDRFERLFAAGRESLAHGSAAAAADEFGSALKLWRGPALADVLFAPFGQGEAERLEERRLLATEGRVEAALALGSGTDLIADLERLVRDHPLRERLLAQLMLALYRAGRQSEALAICDAARRRLAEDLGLEPGPLLQALQGRILNHDPILGGPPVAALDPPRRTWRWPRWRRHPAILAALTITTLAVASTVLAALLGADRAASSARPSAGSQLVGLNLRSGERVQVVPLRGAPAAMTGRAGSLWLADPDGGTVSRVDLAANALVERIPLGGNPGIIATGGGSMWVAGLPGARLTRIDPETEAVTQTLRLGGGAAALASAYARLWIADAPNGALIQLDPATGRRLRSVPLDLQPTALAVGTGAIWAADYRASAVAEVDPHSGRTLATVSVPHGPVALAVGAGAVWVASGLDSTVSRIDPVRASVVATIPVGSGPVALAVAGGFVWVANRYSGTVSRIDPERNVVVGSTPVGGIPTTITVAGGRLWVGVRPRAQHRGGTLVMLASSPLAIDPGVESGVPPFQNLGLTSDGLVTYNHVSGPSGLQVVPDLAISLPTPSDGGKTYTFRLRPHIRYSDGRLVRASDFRRGIERAFRMHSLDRVLLAGIVGADACVERRATACDLRRGVVVNDLSRTVTFHLSGPDPGFLSNLTNGGVAVPVPPGTPLRDAGFAPIPGTGPYKVASADAHHIRYVRNPLFREWSHAAQPTGDPDEIVWRFGLSAAQEVREIEQGRADWMADPIPGALLPRLRTRFASQLHSYPTTDTEFLQLNASRPPLNDLRVRRALNLAIDRRVIVRNWGGPGAAEPTCQLLPHGVPGYRHYCPYAGPDLARARELVAASGTRGATVNVWGWTDDAFAPVSEVKYVAAVLRALGYRTQLRFVPHATLAGAPAHVFAPIQILPVGWAAINAWDFIATWLSCASDGDHGWFCVPRLDRAMRAARSLEATNPRAGALLWQRVDRELVDRAALVPLVNPRATAFVSRRVRNFQQHAYLSFIADQVWLT